MSPRLGFLSGRSVMLKTFNSWLRPGIGILVCWISTVACCFCCWFVESLWFVFFQQNNKLIEKSELVRATEYMLNICVPNGLSFCPGITPFSRCPKQAWFVCFPKSTYSQKKTLLTCPSNWHHLQLWVVYTNPSNLLMGAFVNITVIVHPIRDDKLDNHVSTGWKPTSCSHLGH